MKVYVMFKFKPFGKSEYVGVKKSEKEALETFKKMFPYMRGTVKGNNLSSDKDNTWLLQIKEEEI